MSRKASVASAKMFSIAPVGVLLVFGFVLFVVPSASRATIIVSDTWQDTNRTQPPPTLTAPFTTTYSENGVDQDGDGDIESSWYAATATTLTVPGAGDL